VEESIILHPIRQKWTNYFNMDFA